MTLTEPPDPLAADPVRTTTAPELPDAAVPLINNNDPDVPNEAAFEVANVMEPVVALLLPPAMIDTDPPVCEAAVVAPALITTCPPVAALDSPADSNIWPPAPLVPGPTTTLALPPCPPVELPVSSTTDPLFPDCASPLLNISNPEVPDDKAGDVANRSEPVELDVLAPLMTETEPPTSLEPVAEPPRIEIIPPDDADDTPADSTTLAPTPKFVLPPRMLTEPAKPPFAAPVDN